jgi:hypothetical protein
MKTTHKKNNFPSLPSPMSVFCCVDPIPGLGDCERGRRGVLQRDRLRAGALQCRRFQPLYAVAGRHYATQRARNKGIIAPATLRTAVLRGAG